MAKRVLRKQIVEARRHGAVHLLAVQENRSGVLLAAKNELSLLFARDLLPPRGQCSRHPD
jgi:hypothetical protein